MEIDQHFLSHRLEEDSLQCLDILPGNCRDFLRLPVTLHHHHSLISDLDFVDFLALRNKVVTGSSYKYKNIFSAVTSHLWYLESTSCVEKLVLSLQIDLLPIHHLLHHLPVILETVNLLDINN